MMNPTHEGDGGLLDRPETEGAKMEDKGIGAWLRGKAGKSSKRGEAQPKTR